MVELEPVFIRGALHCCKRLLHSKLTRLHTPQGFVTAVLQAHARKHRVPVDAVYLNFGVTEYASGDSVPSPPASGVFVDGIVVEAARWDPAAKCLSEPLPGVMTSALPVLHITPQHASAPSAAATPRYSCPLYKTAGRAGSLTTTGQSSNFVMSVDLPMRPGTHSDHWVLQGVALVLCHDGE